MLVATPLRISACEAATTDGIWPASSVASAPVSWTTTMLSWIPPHVPSTACNVLAWQNEKQLHLNTLQSLLNIAFCWELRLADFATCFRLQVRQPSGLFLSGFHSLSLFSLMLDTQLSSVDYSSKIKPNAAGSNNPLIKDAAVQLSPSAEKQLTIMTDDKFYPTEITDAKNTVSSSTTHLDRKVSRSFKSANKRSTILGNADLAASLKTQPQSSLNNATTMPPPPARMDSLQRTRADQHKDLPQLPAARTPTRHKPTRSVGLDDLPQLAAAAVASKKHMMTHLPHNIHITTGPSGKPRIYFSELSALQYMIIRYVAVVQIEQYVKSSFSSSELLNLIEFKKSSIWGKFFIPFKAKKNHGPKAKEEGTFGVPLDILTERTGVESNLGSGHSPLKLASFIDDAITAMRQMDMTVEGVFRKNGNIRRLKELADALDRNANDVDLTQENAIQVAALLKKFLRDLPDPLLTHRLHPLFMCAESK